ncbi:DUF771 domain-containing protein [Paenibacillus campinasensis]|uniref:DUF771 domain-containing protein n=1 Tax=Paenibacillus campinasensis TaxID=66347 RepID=A0A268EKQ1_9BACL|nr:DUF771 domain-containing protein [Paenibacillus campinasensis]PAD73699.1 hypothetical protein CHH67_19890 [Paenibacillus campinasensis]
MESTPIFKLIVDEGLVRELAKEEVRRLLKESGEGIWWDMKRLEFETCRKRDWLISKILLNPRFKSEMEQITNGCEGGRWMFKGAEMKSFLDKHFHYLNRSEQSKVIS